VNGSMSESHLPQGQKVRPHSHFLKFPEMSNCNSTRTSRPDEEASRQFNTLLDVSILRL
jgi:hypothetical protein